MYSVKHNQRDHRCNNKHGQQNRTSFQEQGSLKSQWMQKLLESIKNSLQADDLNSQAEKDDELGLATSTSQPIGEI